MSDLHIGAANVDYDLIECDLKDATNNGDRININGDLFDMILPRDRKRYRPEALHPSLQGTSDVVTASVEMGYEMLKPYAKNIDMIGLGNHERAVETHHSIDVTASIVRKLNKLKKVDIGYGGITGFIDYRYRSKTRTSSYRFVIWYHHGSGGSAPVTKGMIDFARKGNYVDSDVVWLGHKHNRLADTTPLRVRCPLEGDEEIYDQQVFVMTGGYMNYNIPQTTEDVMRDGRKSVYSEDFGLPPQQKGGVRVLVKLDYNSGIRKISVIS